MEQKSKTKGKGAGYREPTTISLREAEGWSAEPQTISRVQELSEMIVKGESRESVQKYAMDTYHIQARQARAYYTAAVKFLQPEDEEEYRNGLIQANLNRLETIVERTMKDKDYRNAISAIKEINSLIQPKNNSVTIGKQGDMEVIQINFD